MRKMRSKRRLIWNHLVPGYRFVFTAARSILVTCTGCCFSKTIIHFLKTIFMGKLIKGFLGGVSGKVGPVVGGNWKNKDYMRSRPRTRKTTSPKIDAQRARFALAAKFLRTMRELLVVTFPEFSNAMTGRNNAVSHLLKKAITGDYPDFSIKYSEVIIARGAMTKPIAFPTTSAEPGKISFKWTDDTGTGSAKADDKSILVAYCESLERCIYTTSGSPRNAATASLDVSLFSGKEVQTWIAFISANGKDVSDSFFTGAVTVA
jgi:Family of unknown function (DUF6266)